jgi:hypothetical protein
MGSARVARGPSRGRSAVALEMSMPTSAMARTTAGPHPMVMTASASRTTSSVRGLGNSLTNGNRRNPKVPAVSGSESTPPRR